MSDATDPTADAKPAQSTADQPVATLEFVLAPEDLPLLARTPGLIRDGTTCPTDLIWYDSPTGDLAAQDLALLRDGRLWRLDRLRPGRGVTWPAATPYPTIACGTSPAALRPTPPFDAVPIAAFQGRRRTYRRGGTQLTLLHGALRGVLTARPACRLTLTGPRPEIAATAHALAAALRLAVPRATLALEAAAVATGAPLAARHLGAPEIDPDLPVGDGLEHVLGHLLDALLYWRDQCVRGHGAEPVHQARVATRRLRSALSVYKRAAGCAELDAVVPALKHCAARLGAARDWDVFLDGAGARLAETLPDNPRVTTLLRAATRRRAEAYADLRAFFASPAFRQLEVDLACAAALRPWDQAADPAALDQPTAAFAKHILAHRMKRVRKAANGLATLPIPALHELRKDCKRLRYAAEFFAAGFPRADAKLFIRRLAALQEELGALNDGAAAAGLMRGLGPIGRGYAGGLVEGMAAAAAAPTRARIAKAWKRFRAAPQFWAG